MFSLILPLYFHEFKDKERTAQQSKLINYDSQPEVRK